MTNAHLVQRIWMVVSLPPLLIRSMLASAYARDRHAPGGAFARFGRSVGLRAIAGGHRSGFDLLLTPVSIVRYWEFPFVLSALSDSPGECLDVASPRLFSYFVAENRSPTSIRVINPDSLDAAETARLAASLRIPSLSVEAVPVSALASDPRTYDSIWSISVLEHIDGEGDVEAMSILWQKLRPGGRLAITVPVDRIAWNEFRGSDVYRTGRSGDERGFFFQRWYDEPALRQRLLDPIGASPKRLEWFGERRAGHFAEYEQDWIRRGHRRTVDDPREIADHYTTFADWSSMPGRGVAGVVLEKPA